MQEKQCSMCQETKLASEFYVSGKYLYSHCKTCKKKKDRNAYRNNKKENSRRKFTTNIKRSIRRLQARIFVYDILSKSKCIDCGESRLETLDFDHVRGNKSLDVSMMINVGFPISDIGIEISKCDVRCANCHRVKTFKQNKWARANWNTANAEQQLAVLLKKDKDSQVGRSGERAKKSDRKALTLFSIEKEESK